MEFSFLRFLLPFLLLFSGCVEIYEDIAYMVDDVSCDLRVGVIADPEMSTAAVDRVLQQALDYFACREVDAVVVIGDLTEDGALAQWRRFAAVWGKAFPNGRHPELGKPVALIPVTGVKDTPQVWEGATGEGYRPFFTREVNGFTFIGANYKNQFSAELGDLRKVLSEVDVEKPFFYVQQLIPYGTCCERHAADLKMFDGGKVTYLLSQHPNAIALCARSEIPLTDEQAFWHGDFVCVNAGALVHGLVVSVYGSKVVFERLDLGKHELAVRSKSPDWGTAEKLGGDWVLELPATPNATVRDHTPPRFWDDARLMFMPSEKVLTLGFPPILAKHTGVRAYDYVVRGVAADGTELPERVVQPSAWFEAESREVRTVSVIYDRKSLPTGRITFTVTPRNAFGDCGKSLTGSVNML